LPTGTYNPSREGCGAEDTGGAAAGMTTGFSPAPRRSTGTAPDRIIAAKVTDGQVISVRGVAVGFDGDLESWCADDPQEEGAAAGATVAGPAVDPANFEYGNRPLTHTFSPSRAWCAMCVKCSRCASRSRTGGAARASSCRELMSVIFARHYLPRLGPDQVMPLSTDGRLYEEEAAEAVAS
jgi:hypothetical protein